VTINIGNTTAGDFVCDSEAEMIRIVDAVVGNTCLRRDAAPPLGTLYVLTALPPTTAANWKTWAEVFAGGSGGGGFAISQTVSALGLGADVPVGAASQVSIEFAPPTGSVTQVQVLVQDGTTGAIIGACYYPSGIRWFDLPNGTTSVKLNTVLFAGTGTIGVTIAGQ
jgi:hypothetical protein